MRHIFITDLVKELLGPRRGAVESLPISDKPKDEYKTGQLMPFDSGQERSPDEEDSLGEESSNADEDSDETAPNFVNQAFIEAGQNFRRIPSSMGISFILDREPDEDDISVCITWARYEKLEEQSWIRRPKRWISDFSRSMLRQGVESEDGSLLLTFKVTKLYKGKFKVSIFLKSQVCTTSDKKIPQSEEIIFQPEIRILLKNKDWLSELGELSFTSEDEEWRSSTRQYDKLKAYARGHLCGAYWHEIDPQKAYQKKIIPEPDVPFKWVDGLYFMESDARIKTFMHPHLRTDFIPMYSSPIPPLAQKSNNLKDLNANSIAGCSSFNQFKEYSDSLISSYEKWIYDLIPEPETKDLDKKIINKHKIVLERMRRGVEFLKNDKNAFLSFLFMNKVMATQFRWGKKNNTEMQWKPFQLAFILLSIESAAKDVPDRKICDTIWFPTGGGKTEAYLGLAAFVLAYRRRISSKDEDGSTGGDGTAVISRYTLRLLTIQQFRRALKMITACEILRCHPGLDGTTGWTPDDMVHESGYIWGHSPFSIGLWVGADVTPNNMIGEKYKEREGAVPILKRASTKGPDPAQILNCPCCDAVLSFPNSISQGYVNLRLHVSGTPKTFEDIKTTLSNSDIIVDEISHSFQPGGTGENGYLSIRLLISKSITSSALYRWWDEGAGQVLGVSLHSFNVTRPGYVPIQSERRGGNINDYEIRCPNADCDLNLVKYKYKLPNKDGKWVYQSGHPFFMLSNDENATQGICVNAITVDDKLYKYPPSMIVSTVDKFAQLAYTNEAASLFGRIRSISTSGNGGFSQTVPNTRFKHKVPQFAPPSLIIQDELHLLDGPLGSTFGLFEAAINKLCESPKYVASSATIRNSSEQIQCLIGRENSIFPPPNLDISNGFFHCLDEALAHPLNESDGGRLFLGLAFPGRPVETPMVRLWSRLLQTAQDQSDIAYSIDDVKIKNQLLNDVDYFWTLVGYFNAIRELAKAETLVRQDIPIYLKKLQLQNPTSTVRPNVNINFENLSSQTESSKLPGILTRMEKRFNENDSLSSVASTSMFGTGVDVSRLSLMVVHGQPKTSSQYIQAVGRIGRSRAGLAIVFFRVSKPRDLNHYEYFTGYHRKLAVAVEPISVKPFAPRALDRFLGAIIAILARNWTQNSPRMPDRIDQDDGADEMFNMSDETLKELIEVFVKKWTDQPEKRKVVNKERLMNIVKSKIELWKDIARKEREAHRTLKYKNEDGVSVLGRSDQAICVFPSSPQSLREVEVNINIETRR